MRGTPACVFFFRFVDVASLLAINFLNFYSYAHFLSKEIPRKLLFRVFWCFFRVFLFTRVFSRNYEYYSNNNTPRVCIYGDENIICMINKWLMDNGKTWNFQRREIKIIKMHTRHKFIKERFNRIGEGAISLVAIKIESVKIANVVLYLN